MKMESPNTITWANHWQTRNSFPFTATQSIETADWIYPATFLMMRNGNSYIAMWSYTTTRNTNYPLVRFKHTLFPLLPVNSKAYASANGTPINPSSYQLSSSARPILSQQWKISVCIMEWLDWWDASNHMAIMNNCCDKAKLCSKCPKEPTLDTKVCQFNHRVLDRCLCAAIQGITSCNTSGLLFLEDSYTKNSVKCIKQVDEEKHPVLHIPDLTGPSCSCFEKYPAVSKALLASSSADAVNKMTPWLSGGAGPSGIDAVASPYWLTSFEHASSELQEEMVYWQDLLAYMSPPWAVYCALMVQWLDLLGKHPGLHPVGIIEIFQQLLAKLVIADAGNWAKLACGSLQLCDDLKAWIKSMLHAIHKWVSSLSEDVIEAATPHSQSTDLVLAEEIKRDNNSLFPPDVPNPQQPHTFWITFCQCPVHIYPEERQVCTLGTIQTLVRLGTFTTKRTRRIHMLLFQQRASPSNSPIDSNTLTASFGLMHLTVIGLHLW